jgi:FkbM family methyltransferase
MMSNYIFSFASFTARILPMPIKQLAYRLGPISRIIRKGLNAVLPKGLTPVTIASGALADMRIAINLESEKSYWLGTYEPDLQSAIQDLVKPGMKVYDVGANIGFFTLLFANIVGEAGKVFAFEALPRNIERLRINLALNRLEERVSIISSAVIDGSRDVNFFLGPSDNMGKANGSAGRPLAVDTENIPIPGISLDDFVYKEGYPAPHVVKMDIEGGEVLALPGMRQLLRVHQPVLLLECHGRKAIGISWEILSGQGYSIRRLQRNYPIVSTPESLDRKAYLVALPPGISPV